jgi:uncharacterized integral membrane protein
MRFLVRLIFWGFVFLALFAFSVNNRQAASVHWFFGVEWRTPMVIVVLAAFVAGCAVGVLAMVPSWWRHRRLARRHAPPKVVPSVQAPSPSTPQTTESELEMGHPPRHGL